MTWPQGKRSVSKMSDFDFALDTGCGQQVFAPVDWQAAQADVTAATSCLRTNEQTLGHWLQDGAKLPKPIRCREQLQTAAVVAAVADIDSRYSSWRNDCYLGWLSFFLFDLVCTLHEALTGEQASRTTWPLKWRKAQLELEGLFFYVELPWHVMASQPWPIAALMARLAGALQLTEHGSNHCDNSQEVMDDLLHQAAHEWWLGRGMDATPLLPLHLAEEFIVLEAVKPLAEPRRCTFGVVAALLSVAIWALKANMLDGFSDGPTSGRSPQQLVSGQAQQLTKLWEERTPQFFYDLLTSHWRVPELLEQLAALWPKLQEQKLSPSGPLTTRGILFIGGGDTTYQWGSFTVRGRQMARGFRKRGIDARAWNSPCNAWCQHEQRWYPTSVVHVKYICLCAALGWPRAAHVFDPVDNFDVLMNITAVDALLVQTSLSKRDLEENPNLRRPLFSANVAVHWLPLHHLNAHGLRVDPANRVTRVGVHTVHADSELRKAVEQGLANFFADTGEVPEFTHLDPGRIFEHNEGKITTPQHTDAVYQQLTTLQVGFAKQSGCLTDWWHCSRWKTGQRLVNMMSVGIPSIVWGDAQGHLDVVKGLWPPEDAPPMELQEVLPDAYPDSLVISSDAGVTSALKALLSNASLRLEASTKGLMLADRFSLERIVDRLDAILLNIEARKAVLQPLHQHINAAWCFHCLPYHQASSLCWRSARPSSAKNGFGIENPGQPDGQGTAQYFCRR